MATSKATDPRVSLKTEMEKRVRELRLKWREVAATAGYSVSWIRHIRNDPNKDITPEVAAALDRALEWEPGSTMAILAGGKPTPLPVSSAPPLTPAGDHPALEAPPTGDLETPDSVLEMMERWQPKLSVRDFALLTVDLMRVREGAYQEGWLAARAWSGRTP